MSDKHDPQDDSWFSRWFNSDYLLCYGHKTQEEGDRDVDFLIRTMKLNETTRLFDMACGAGRHLIPFHRAGFNVWGGDLSLKLLEQLKLSCPELSRKVFQYDMRKMPEAFEPVDLVLNMFTSFGYFDSEDEDRLVLQNVNRMLQRGGLFVIDFLNIQGVLDSLKSDVRKHIGDTEIIELRHYDDSSKRLTNKICVRDRTGERPYFESVRAYSYQEMTLLLLSVGFSILKVFGGFSGESYTDSSPRLLLICRKEYAC